MHLANEIPVKKWLNRPDYLPLMINKIEPVNGGNNYENFMYLQIN